MIATTLFALALVAPAHAKPKCDIDDLTDRYLAAFNDRDVDTFYAAFAPEYAVTSPYGAFDLAGWDALVQGTWYAFPDMHWSVARTVVEDDYIVYHYTFTGTFTHDFFGYTAKGQAISGSGMEMHRYDEDTCRMVTTWNYSDAAGFLAQLQ